MDSREKAIELFESFLKKSPNGSIRSNRGIATKCALLHIEGILISLKEQIIEVDSLDILYWYRVRKELEQIKSL